LPAETAAKPAMAEAASRILRIVLSSCRRNFPAD
jgi:hypothetical protein